MRRLLAASCACVTEGEHADDGLAVIFRRNTGIGAELPDDVFHVPQ